MSSCISQNETKARTIVLHGVLRDYPEYSSDIIDHIELMPLPIAGVMHQGQAVLCIGNQRWGSQS